MTSRMTGTRYGVSPTPRSGCQCQPFLLKQTSSPHPYHVTRPNGTRWTRTFTSAPAAWRVLLPGLTGPAARIRRAEMVRAGWRVEAERAPNRQ